MVRRCAIWPYREVFGADIKYVGGIRGLGRCYRVLFSLYKVLF